MVCFSGGMISQSTEMIQCFNIIFPNPQSFHKMRHFSDSVYAV